MNLRLGAGGSFMITIPIISTCTTAGSLRLKPGFAKTSKPSRVLSPEGLHKTKLDSQSAGKIDSEQAFVAQALLRVRFLQSSLCLCRMSGLQNRTCKSGCGT